MVHVEDLGSQFDAPIETVWKFIQTGDDHGRSHGNRRNIQGAPDGEHGMRVTWEQKVGADQWVKVVNRVTMFPPVAMLIDSVEGPLAGSKFLFYYKANGAKTVVNAVGDFQSPMIPAAQLPAVVLANFEEAFNDDNAALRRLAGSR